MKPKSRFARKILAAMRKTKGLRIRAGNGSHRFIGIWFVLVNDRVFVRSWSVQATGWYRAFQKDPQGAIRVGKHEYPVLAVRTTSKSLRDAVDRAYLLRYKLPGALRYAKDLCLPKSRSTTTELLPGQN